MKRWERFTARTKDARPGVPFALVIGVALGVLIANLARPAPKQVASPQQSGTAVPAVTAPGAPTAPVGSAPAVSSSVTSAGPESAPASAGVPRQGGSGAPPTRGRVSTAGPVRGVTDTTIKLGVSYLDLSGVQYLGPDYNIGDVQKQWKALIDGWHRRHLLPVNGRDIQLYFSTYNVLTPDRQRAACEALITDAKVFAVLSPEYFYQYGAECVTTQYHTPLITSDGPSADVYQRGSPFLYTIMPSASAALENMVYWARDHGLLKGRKIGVYHFNDANEQRLIDQSVKAPLARLGYPVAVEQTTGDRNGGPNDAIAVQRFKANNVNLAIVTTSNFGFSQQADVQDYHPRYIGSDYNGYTTYLGAANYQKGQMDGQFAVTHVRRGDAGSGIPLNKDAQACVDNYNRYSGEHLARQNRKGAHDAAAMLYVLISCDEGAILLKALQQAGRDLTPLKLVREIQTIRNMPTRYFSPISFGPDRYTGVTQQVTLQWKGDCTCWQKYGSYEPMSLSRR